MIKVLAVCHLYPEFHRNRILDPVWAKRFQGAGLLPYFSEIARGHGIQVVTGDEALDHIRHGYWHAEDVGVWQDLDAPMGKALLQLGAVPLLMTCLEAPIYAPRFYDQLADWVQPYPARLMYRGCYTHLGQALPGTPSQNKVVRFPSLYEDDILTNWRPWALRKPMVTVLTNKFFKPYRSPWPFVKKRHKPLAKRTSPTWREVEATQLHTQRLEALTHFLKRNQLSIYGSGWQDVSNLPMDYQKVMPPLLKTGYLGRCDNKITTMADYRFGLCLENQRYSGYVTEKLIQCLAAGVVPLYWGAPDVTDFVPANCFIDLSQFASWEEASNYIEAFSESQAKAMHEAALAFLYSDEGRQHHYPVFAQCVWDQLEPVISSASVKILV